MTLLAFLNHRRNHHYNDQPLIHSKSETIKWAQQQELRTISVFLTNALRHGRQGMSPSWKYKHFEFKLRIWSFRQTLGRDKIYCGLALVLVDELKHQPKPDVTGLTHVLMALQPILWNKQECEYLNWPVGCINSFQWDFTSKSRYWDLGKNKWGDVNDHLEFYLRKDELHCGVFNPMYNTMNTIRSQTLCYEDFCSMVDTEEGASSNSTETPALRYPSQSLYHDEAIVMAAIQNDGSG